MKIPEYRFKWSIVDVETEQNVVTGSTYISGIDEGGSCESVELELFSGLMTFRNKARAEHEKEFYSQECPSCHEIITLDDWVSVAGTCVHCYNDLKADQKQKWGDELVMY